MPVAAWVNDRLRAHQMLVTDITTDFKSGVLLAQLVALLSNADVPVPHEARHSTPSPQDLFSQNPSSDAQCVANIRAVLHFLDATDECPCDCRSRACV